MAKNRVKAIPINPKAIILEGSFQSVAAEEDFLRTISGYALASLRRSSGKNVPKKIDRTLNGLRIKPLIRTVHL